MTNDSAEILLARLDERSKAAEKILSQLADDQKETSEVLSTSSTEALNRIKSCEKRILDLEAECKELRAKLDTHVQEKAKRTDDLVWDVVKMVVVALVTSLLTYAFGAKLGIK